MEIPIPPVRSSFDLSKNGKSPPAGSLWENSASRPDTADEKGASRPLRRMIEHITRSRNLTLPEPRRKGAMLN